MMHVVTRRGLPLIYHGAQALGLRINGSDAGAGSICTLFVLEEGNRTGRTSPRSLPRMQTVDLCTPCALVRNTDRFRHRRSSVEPSLPLHFGHDQTLSRTYSVLLVKVAWIPGFRTRRIQEVTFTACPTFPTRQRSPQHHPQSFAIISSGHQVRTSPIAMVCSGT